MPRAESGLLLREIKSLVGDGDRDELPDGRLLTRFVDHKDDTAFEALVRRYGRLVFGVCRRVLADPHAAEDAFQATFLVLVHKAASLDRRRPIADWLYTVAHRLAGRARANAARRRAKEADAARGRADFAEPATSDDVHAVLHEELSRLPAVHRLPLVLSYLEGRTYPQVAKALGCPVGTVGWRLTRAREVLGGRLTNRGVACPAVGLAALLATSTAGASVPASLFDTTVRAGLWFAGERMPGLTAASAGAVQLARGALGTASTKFAVMAGVVMAVGLCGGTAWLAGSSSARDAKPAPSSVAAPEPTKLPDGATARFGSSQFRHGELVFFVAYTADGNQLVTAGRDKAIVLWDRASGREVRRFERAVKKLPPDARPAPGDAMTAGRGMRPIAADDFPVALSPDGKTLAAGQDKTVTVWDVATGKATLELSAEASVYDLHFTPDGSALVGADANQAVTLWDSATGNVRKTFKVVVPAPGGSVQKTGGAVSPAGAHLVLQLLDTQSANGVLRIFDLATGAAQPDIKLSAGGAQNVTFSPDGKFLAWSAFIEGVTVWDVAAQKEVARLGKNGTEPKFFGPSIHFSRDGKTLAVTLANDAIELWDVPTGKLTRTIGGYQTERAHRVAVRVVVGSGNRMGRADLDFAPDGKTVAASLGNATVRQFDAGTGAEVAATGGHLSGVIAVGSDGRTVVTVSKESIRVWEAAGGRELRRWPLSPPAVAAAVSPDGKRVATAAGTGGLIRLWDVATGEKARDIDTKRPDVAGLGFSPNGALLATKAELNAAVNLWDTATGAHVRTLGQDGEPTFSAGRVTLELAGVQTPGVVFSNDGRLVAAAGDKKQLCVWDVATGSPVCEIPIPARKFVVGTAFSANGQVLAAVTSGGAVTGYEVATGEPRYDWTPPTSGGAALYPAEISGGAMAVSSLGRGVATGGGVGFSVDGRFVVSAAGGPAVRVWDTLTGQEATEFRGHQGSVSALRFAADGRSLVTGSVDTTALAWDVGRFPRVELTRESPMGVPDLESLWADLASADSAAAFAASRKLLTDRQSAVAMLKDRLRPVPAVEGAQVERLVADLSGSFDARRKATAELERLGEPAAPQLRKALEGNPMLDLNQRVERLLAKAAVQQPRGDQLRESRAVEVLELAGTPEAERVLDALARGAAGARLTRDAGAALARLSAAK